MLLTTIFTSYLYSSFLALYGVAAMNKWTFGSKGAAPLVPSMFGALGWLTENTSSCGGVPEDQVQIRDARIGRTPLLFPPTSLSKRSREDGDESSDFPSQPVIPERRGEQDRHADSVPQIESRGLSPIVSGQTTNFRSREQLLTLIEQVLCCVWEKPP